MSIINVYYISSVETPQEQHIFLALHAVADRSNGHITIDISQLKAGMYLLTIEGMGLKQQLVRFVKNQ